MNLNSSGDRDFRLSMPPPQLVGPIAHQREEAINGCFSLSLLKSGKTAYGPVSVVQA